MRAGGRKAFEVVASFFLLVAHSDEACTMTLVRSISESVLEFKHPSARNALGTMGHRGHLDNLPAAHFLQLFNLLDHCFEPFRIIRRLAAHLVITGLGKLFG